jgi:hypothetical protein
MIQEQLTTSRQASCELGGSGGAENQRSRKDIARELMDIARQLAS